MNNKVRHNNQKVEGKMDLEDKDKFSENQSLQNKLKEQQDSLAKDKEKFNAKKIYLSQEKEALGQELSKTKALQETLADQEIKLSIERLNIEKDLPRRFFDYKNQLDEEAQHKEDHLNLLKDELNRLRMELLSERNSIAERGETLLQKEQDFDLSSRKKVQDLLDDANEDIRKDKEDVRREIIEIKNDENKRLDDELKEKREQLEKELEELSTKKKEVAKQQADNQLNKQTIIARKDALDQHIDMGISDFKLSLEKELKQKNNEIERLRNQVESSEESLGLYKELKKQLGADPAKVLANIAASKDELNRLNKELLERPTQDIQDYYDKAKLELKEAQARAERFKNENDALQKEVGVIEEVSSNLHLAKNELSTLQTLISSKEAENNKLKNEIDRLTISYKEEGDRDERLKQIQKGIIIRPQDDKSLPSWPVETNELTWLNTIKINISDFGLEFDHRILYAFHTALKISEWSPLTVLAGVSGTGKSELPKLYSHFGGINFMSVPVQPNWDSQESMLGYFNAIDDVFDAQPILKFLIQSQTDQSTNPDGLKDMMNIVLLDEMNLAHVEMYFADFLSKLEERRATGENNLPSIDIKLGAKHAPHKLELGRNMLFAGTMNQDETTKALSDKVLDRGVTIYFPRPTTLIAREKLKVKKPTSHFLSSNQWIKWVKYESNLNNELQKKYKGIIEKINEHLGEVGKALGHRVWQSIEYFMVNHPLVLAFSHNGFDDENHKKALYFAFEDQLVQKVMPKLRGIETRGIGKDRCLSPISALLDSEKFNIAADFERAMVMGHGQFMWCSADYLNDEESKEEYDALVQAALLEFKNKSLSNTKNVNKKASLAPEKLKKLAVYARTKNVEVTNLSAEQVSKCLEVGGFEAKDVMAYLVENAPKVSA